MKNFFRQIGALVGYARVLQRPTDFLRYMQLRSNVRQQASLEETKVLHVRSLGGAALLCRPTQDVWTFKHTFLEGFHAPPRALPEHPTIVDLGTNVGYTVADLAYQHPTARVIGVEMDAENLELARRNTAWLGARVELVHAAAWTTDGTISYAGDADDAFTVVAHPHPQCMKTAPAKSLATLFAEHHVERVDYMKMDIEGAEGPIFAGPLDWLNCVHMLKIEIHPPVDAGWCKRVLQENGFECWMDDQHWNCICAVRN